MAWEQILGHDSNFQRFAASLKNGRLASTFLFVGPAGIGKRTFAIELAKGLLCENSANDSLHPCDQCPSCKQVAASTHPDLIEVSRPAGAAFIPVELLIGDKEHRRQKGLCHDIGLKPYSGKRKVAIIDDADFLNIEGANSLLKTLEEPPANSILILIGTSEQQQLPTILSRSQVIRFAALDRENVETILGRLSLETDIPTSELAAASGGSIERVERLIESEVFQFRNHFFDRLSTLDPAANGYTSEVMSFLDDAGKEAASKRNRAVLVGDFAIDFFSHWLADVSGRSGEIEDRHLAGAVATIPTSNSVSSLELGQRIAQCIECTIRMQKQIRANVMPVNAIELWLRDLGRACRGQLNDALDAMLH